MKKLTKMLLLSMLTGVLLLSGCNHAVTDETDTAETTLTETEPVETEAPAPVLTPSDHTISVSDVNSILAANEMSLASGRLNPYSAVHGGQQMRVVHTERGTYTAFVKFFDDVYGGETEFYVAKIDNDNKVTLLYYGEYFSDASTVQLNIGQDTNGDIVVTTTTLRDLNVYLFDAETDAVTAYTQNAVFTSGFTPAYSQTMFDFEGREISAFYCGTPGKTQESDDFLLEWFTFDMNTMQWTAESTYYIFEDIHRHAYLYPFPDGNGGAYIVGEANPYISALTGLENVEPQHKFTFDRLRLFHIPDLSSNENITHVMIQEPYTERGLEGTWSSATNNQNGCVFVDADGYMHIVYQYYLRDYSGKQENFDKQLQYRHAIYDGMNCIYNEKIEVSEPVFTENLMYHITQGTDGTLYLIVGERYADPFKLYLYRADDSLGKSWTHKTTASFEGSSAFSFSISAPRNGSLQDNIIDGFYYTYFGARTVCTFRISLDDCSITEPVDLLKDFGLEIDEVQYFEPYYSAHQNQVIHTENGTYAAFVYNYGYQYYNPYYSNLGFCITKTDADGKSTVLYDGIYQGDQEEFLNIQMLSDGKIYVFLPTAEYVYIVDPADDTVTEQEIALRPVLSTDPQQVTVIEDTANGKNYALTITGTANDWWSDSIRIDSKTMNTEDLSLSKRAKMLMSNKLEGYYTDYYLFPDGNGGAYAIASRRINPNDVEGLNFVGRTDSIKDTVALLHIASLDKNSNIEIIDIQAPYTDEAADGIWSVVNMTDEGDAYMDADGKLHVIYSYYHMDLDDMDAPGNAELKTNTLKRYHVVLEGTTIVSMEELAIDGLSETASLRMAQTTDGTLYLIVCNTGEEGAKIDVYFETESGWALTQTKDLGEFTAGSFGISSPRGGSVQDNVIDCIVYANDSDVYYTSVTFE
ncbi:MAG: hypothetical protein IJ325_03535 [Clostridia bacterium]|nr:hypothetical protein [Clostridia bacterium]